MGKIKETRFSGKWTKEEIIESIFQLEKDDISLNPTYIKKNHSTLYNAACNHYGSWAKAVKSTGLPYQKYLVQKSPDYWTEDRVISDIRSLANKGENLHLSFANVYHSPLVNAAENRFGSWKMAVERAGILYDSYVGRKPRFWKKEEDEFIMKNYSSMSVLEIAKELGRSRQSIMYRAKRIGISNNDEMPWAEPELEILRDPNLTKLEKVKKLSNRSSKKVRGVIEYRGFLSKTPEIKTMRHLRRGYIFLKTTKDGRDHGIREHRVIASEIIGRPLKSHETVHHINMDKLDNHPENLLICSRKEHGDVHASLDRLVKDLLQLEIIRFDDDLGYILVSDGGEGSG